MDGDVRAGLLSAEEPLITIEPARLDYPEAEALVGEAFDEMRQRYGDENVLHVSLQEFTGAAGGAFLLARIEGRPVGCIGLCRYDDGIGEIKRMYVVPDARRQGVGRVLLDALEAHARRLGYRAIILETGTRQPEALGLYESRGYSRIPNYGHWADSPLSVCFEKRLT